MDALDALDIEILQGSSLDPCPQAAEAVLWLRGEVERLRAALLSVQTWDSIWEALPNDVAKQVSDALSNEQSSRESEK